MNNIELDFLIVGAAKAGTTALYRMLEEHPQIFLPKNKEPKFISSQFLHYPLVGPGDSGVEKASCKTMEEFVALYRDKNDGQIIGEGSIDNLYYHDKSIPLIKKYFGNPKIIIMLRNPVDRAYSAYYHLVRDGRETLDFAEALKQEEHRKNNNWQFLWSYFSVGMYYEQVKSYVESFDSVKVIIHDDFVANPDEIMKDVFTFLSVDNDYLAATKNKHNISGVPKNKLYQHLLYPKSLALRKLKKRIGVLFGGKITTKLRSILKGNMLYKPSIDVDVKKDLQTRYQSDIQKLSTFIEKDLNMWNR